MAIPKRERGLTIGTKLNALLALLLVSSIASLVWLSSSLFIEDNTALIQQMNANLAHGYAMRVREVFDGVNGKARLLSSMLLTRKASEPALIDDFFSGDPDLLGVYVHQHIDKGVAVAPQLVRKALSQGLATHGDPDGTQTLTALSQHRGFSFERLAKGESQVVIVSLPDGSTALSIALPLIRTENSFSHSVVTLLRHGRFLEVFSQDDLVTSYLVDSHGILIAHPDATRAGTGESVAHLGIVQDLLKGFNNGQTRYVDAQSREARLGAFRNVGFSGLGVVSEVPEAKAFEAAEKVKLRSALVASMVLFLSFLVGYFFSGTITWPLNLLTEAADRIADGDFHIHLEPKGRDELAMLSMTFNKMAQGLIERDRVKDTFHRFHNKEIAEKLLSGEVKLGGERREATIFFSDVRGFTGMSETMQPEEVVEMLNEYMTVMVSIIRSHHGIVDKYVGDAIMAIWGVPIGRPEDTQNAVRACLEMRRALAELNERRLARGQAALRIGMGLNRGSVIAGNIGSIEKMEYTVIGDAVNLASRMESMTKEYGTDFLVSSQVKEPVSDRFIFEQVESAWVKGKSAPIETYKVLGYIDDQGQPVRIETAYSTVPKEKSDKSSRDPPAA